MKLLINITALILFLLLSLNTAHAYKLPLYSMTAEEFEVPPEETLEEYETRLDDLRRTAPHGILGTRRRDYKTRLTDEERTAAKEYDELIVVVTFWEYVVKLTRDLNSLHGEGASQEAGDEADAMAKIIIQTIYDLSQEYRVTGYAQFQNFLVMTGVREKGLCYHYVSDIRKVLRRREWNHFSMHWGEAWAKTFRENNALVITATGEPFESGIAVDSWRAAGKPFWTMVKGDRYPWVEAVGVEFDDSWSRTFRRENPRASSSRAQSSPRSECPSPQACPNPGRRSEPPPR